VHFVKWAGNVRIAETAQKCQFFGAEMIFQVSVTVGSNTENISLDQLLGRDFGAVQTIESQEGMVMDEHALHCPTGLQFSIRIQKKCQMPQP
jgi:hypothetical protein